MEEHATVEYHWYVVGCHRLGWTPVIETQFWPDYQRYRRCCRAIRKYEERRAQRQGEPTITIEIRLLDRLIHNIKQEQERLSFLQHAIEIGQGADGGDTESNVPRHPRTPTLIGSGAKLHPDLDPEPAWRDP